VRQIFFLECAAYGILVPGPGIKPGPLALNSLEKTLMPGKIEGRRRRSRQSMRWLDGITDSMDMSLSNGEDSEGQGSLACCSPWGCKELDITE